MTVAPRALAVMARAPVPGRSKTRLQPRLGPDGAADLYRSLLLDTLDVARSLTDVEVVIAVDDAGNAAFFAREAPDLDVIVQEGPSLGHRLDHVLGCLLDRGHRSAAAIGSDSPLIEPAAIVEAFEQLEADEADVVFGPSVDGGYYLIATASAPGPLVTEVTMSTPSVMADTLAVARRHDRRVGTVATGFDVDEPADLDRLADGLDRRPEAAPRTRATLAALSEPPADTGAAQPATTDRAPAPIGAGPDWARVAVVIPALDEEAAIADVVARCRTFAGAAVVVVDNGSVDDTAAVADDAGADVVVERRRGYGQACAAGVARAVELGADVVAFVDGDASSPPEELPAVVEPVLAGTADLVQGSRVAGSIAAGAMAFHQRLGNAFAAWLLRRLYPVTVTDLGPFRAIRTDLLDRLDMAEMTYGWPTEMTVKAANRDARIVEVPVSWLPRAGGRSKVSGTVRGSVLAARYIVGVTIAHSRPATRLRDGVRRLRSLRSGG
ncbi:MAG: TIGR04282 family arsenosugar biosynthesis glycosyltransferase [Actinomycetota bacterium]